MEKRATPVVVIALAGIRARKRVGAFVLGPGVGGRRRSVKRSAPRKINHWSENVGAVRWRLLGS